MYFQVQNSNYIQVKRSSRKQVPGAYRLEVEFVDTLRADRRSALFPVSLGFPLSFFFFPFGTNFASPFWACLGTLYNGKTRNFIWPGTQHPFDIGRKHNTRLMFTSEVKRVLK